MWGGLRDELLKELHKLKVIMSGEDNLILEESVLYRFGNLKSNFRNYLSESNKVLINGSEYFMCHVPAVTDRLEDFLITYGNELKGPVITRAVTCMPRLSENSYCIIYDNELRVKGVINDEFAYYDARLERIIFRNPELIAMKYFSKIPINELHLPKYCINELFNNHADLREVFFNAVKEHEVTFNKKNAFLIKALFDNANLLNDFMITYNELFSISKPSVVELITELKKRAGEILPERHYCKYGIIYDPKDFSVSVVFNMAFADYDFKKKELVFKDPLDIIKEQAIMNRGNPEEELIKGFESCLIKVRKKLNESEQQLIQPKLFPNYPPPGPAPTGFRGSHAIMYAAPVPE